MSARSGGGCDTRLIAAAVLIRTSMWQSHLSPCFDQAAFFFYEVPFLLRVPNSHAVEAT